MPINSSISVTASDEQLNNTHMLFAVKPLCRLDSVQISYLVFNPVAAGFTSFSNTN
jgi:hypothetical protein